MSLAGIIRTNDGSIFAAADTALSVEVKGVAYRAAYQEDYEKLIAHPDGTIMFVSGHFKCAKAIREAALSMDTIDIVKLQEYAQLIFEPNKSDDNVGIILCLPDGTIKKMAAQENFEIQEVEWDKSGINLYTFGFYQNEALVALQNAMNPEATYLDIFSKMFNSVLSEEVGGHIVAIKRYNGKIARNVGALTEPTSIRRMICKDCTPDVKYQFHAMIKASQIDASTINASVINVATLNGELTAGAGGGAIVGTSINVGDGKFEVDNDGNCNIQSGAFNAPTITGGTITGSTITGTSKITSLGSMDVSCDITVGGNILMGQGLTASDDKRIFFQTEDSGARIIGNGDSITLSAPYITLEGSSIVCKGEVSGVTATFG
jgi:hypothetical protein